MIKKKKFFVYNVAEDDVKEFNLKLNKTQKLEKSNYKKHKIGLRHTSNNEPFNSYLIEV